MNKREFYFIKLMEEAAEVQHRTSKLLQFGPKEIEPGKSLNNLERLCEELRDLFAIAFFLAEDGHIPANTLLNISNSIHIKRGKLSKYLMYSQKLGFVSE